jgi:choline dehydrogenase
VTERYDTLIVGGGTAGCVLAARLSENPDRAVCLVEAGPDYGPYAGGRWPDGLLDARALAFSHDWGTGGEDERSLGARVIGGCSAHNACMLFEGPAADYDEWGPDWSHAALAPHLECARAALRSTPANTDRPAPFHAAFIEAARESGFPLLADPNDAEAPVGVATGPWNTFAGVRWNTAFAYLDPARDRPNLTILPDTLVDRVSLDGPRAAGVVLAGGRRLEAGLVVLAAGAYFTPAILLRSGVGPERQLRRHRIEVLVDSPVGERLLDHCGSGVTWEPSEQLHELTAAQVRESGPVFQPCVVLKAASSRCPDRSWDIHLLSWTNPAQEREHFEVSCGCFHMKPRSTGTVRLRSIDPDDLPVVERGFLRDPEDMAVIVEGLQLARRVASAEPLRSLLARELQPGDRDLGDYVAATVRNYFHPAGTCGMGSVTNSRGCVLGTENLVVADASLMPTIPRTNTNLTTVAIAEKIASTLI